MYDNFGNVDVQYAMQEARYHTGAWEVTAGTRREDCCCKSLREKKKIMIPI
jgi:hypothetical protein